MLLYSLINIIIVVKYFVIGSGCLVIFRKSTLFFLDFTCLLQKRLLSVLCLGFFRSLQIGYRFMVFNATFNNISVILWQSVLLVEKTWRKSPTCRKSLTNFITQCCIDYISPVSVILIYIIIVLMLNIVCVVLCYNIQMPSAE